MSEDDLKKNEIKSESKKKSKKESLSALFFSVIIIAAFIGVCVFIYKTLISQGRFLELRLDNIQSSEIKENVQIVSQGEAISYNADIGFVVTRSYSNDDEIMVNILVNCAGNNIYIFSPHQIALRATDVDTYEESYASPQETSRFAFIEKQIKRFTFSFPLKYRENVAYSLIIYDEDATAIGNIALDLNV